MIIYGSKGSHLNSERKGGIKCDNCNEITNHTISVYGKYGYIYWIPLFPMGKKVFSECSNCKSTNDFSGMNEKLRQASADLKRNTKTPIWYWSGLGVIALLICFGIFSSNQHKSDIVDYIANPKVNDVIDYKSNDNAYSTLKITKVTADSVYIVANSMEIARQSKLYKIDKAANYNAEKYSLSLEQYKEAHASKRFLDVDR